jgi:hypothetical protein
MNLVVLLPKEFSSFTYASQTLITPSKLEEVKPVLQKGLASDDFVVVDVKLD